MRLNALQRPGRVLAALWFAALVCGLAAVHARHEARKLFVELETLNRERDHLDIDWGRLRIEQGTWATHGRVEQLARERIGLRTPAPGEVRVVSNAQPN